MEHHNGQHEHSRADPELFLSVCVCGGGGGGGGAGGRGRYDQIILLRLDYINHILLHFKQRDWTQLITTLDGPLPAA